MFKQSWKRFLDDCFVLCIKSEKELTTLKDILQNLHPSLKFTMETSQEELSFLDVCVSINHGKVETDIFYKTTDSKLYLDYKSCHPRHTKNSIPYSLSRRICTIVSDKERLNFRLNELKNLLKDRGYPKNVIDDAISKATSYKREDLLKSRVNEKDMSILPLVSTFNPKNPNVFPRVNECIKTLETCPRLRNAMKRTKLINSKRQSKNLKKLLTRAQFVDNTVTHSVKKCNRPNCGTCIHLLEGNSYTFKNNQTFKVKENMSCDTANLIYVIRCAGCNEDYIGQTGNQLRARIRVHKQQIRNPNYRCIPLSAHIDACAEKCTPKFSIFPFYKTENECERKVKENFFIEKYKPKLNCK